MKRQLVRCTSKICFFVGIFLISANTVGLLTSLRNDEIFLEKNVLFEQDITLSAKQVYAAINAPAADKKSYFNVLTHAINKGIAHYWLDEGIDKYNLRIPFSENYLLFITSFIIPQYYRKYELRDYRLAIERGVGLCSQHAIIVAEILKEKGIESGIMTLPDHVIAIARVDDGRNEWWVLDADYGVVLPHGPEEIKKTPDIIAPYYRSRGYDERTIATLTSNYGKKGKVYLDGAKNYGSKIYWAEAATYILVWIIPGLLMIPLIVAAGTRKKLRAGSGYFTGRRTASGAECYGSSTPG
ncbi:MAG: hypothetical protein HY527_09210 [Betaproteobacteria bacterium]|nr:hypothetical protein [Betaproteobacteria bacterium]